MKNFAKIVLIVLFLLCSMLLAVRAEARGDTLQISGESYSVRFTAGVYEAYKSSSSETEPSFKSAKLGEVISYITAESIYGSIRFSDINTSEIITLVDGKYTISGNIDFTDNGGMVIAGADVFFSGLEMNFEKSGIRLKQGYLKIEESTLLSNNTVIKMDYSSSSELNVLSGNISSSSAAGTIDISYGTAKISGGRIVNTSDAAIKNSTTLIISGAPSIVGVDFDVFTSSPITLSENANSYTGNCRVKYDTEFEQGKIAIIAYGTKKDNEGDLKLYDRLGRAVAVKYYENFSGISEEHFLTAYLPYEISFSGNSQMESQYYLSGEAVLLPEAAERVGYDFLGWKIGDYSGEPYDPGLPLEADLVLYPYYRLRAPTFSFLSMKFTFDGDERYLELSELEHPLISEGVLAYKWYKDGEELSFYGDKISIKNVSDSGKYKCLFTFTHKSDVVSVETPEVEVTVFKRKIDIPEVASVEYNGEIRYPEIYSVSLYEVEYTGGVNAGVYPINLKVRDAENYGFGESCVSEATVYFSILQAENQWIEEPRCSDFYSWQMAEPVATAKFGTVRFLFSTTLDGEYTETPQLSIGRYYIKGIVEGTENYTSLSSEAVLFTVMEDSVASLHIVSEAAKKNYVAFEAFLPEGLSVAARYISGKEVILRNDELIFNYHCGECLLFGDTSVEINYGGKTLYYPISVSKAEYDISAIVFSNCEYEYSAQYISPDFFGALPVGADGIPLFATVVGGGTGVGVYAVELRFYGESENYNLPDSIKAIMTVAPKVVDVIWNNVDFVYDGSAKTPTAYYTDLSGQKVLLDVKGARSYAGIYEASAIFSDANYTAENLTAMFVINKADYDLSQIKWTEDFLTYNGSEQRVTLSGLPAGVNVIGYSDNRAVNAGRYTAGVALSYDENNYNPPIIQPHEWNIYPAEYDETSFYFTDGEFVYDGEEHYPIFYGSMPVGIDGSSPRFCYSGGATDVDDGKVRVLIEFSSGSENYSAPRDREFYVQISPRGINVSWSDLSFVYSEKLFAPSAVAEECEILVVGSQISAGNHTAIAKAMNTNYFVINSECEFEILKAENIWSISPSIKSVYTSGSLEPIGEAAYGETLYEYSCDKASLIEAPYTSGKFYFRAISDGDENHLPICSDWISFEIIAVVPVSFSVDMIKTQFLTLEKIGDADVYAYVINNDSSTVEIPASDISIIYNNGVSLAFSDVSVTFSYLHFSVVSEISVFKRDYDLSAVSWEGIRGVYNGEEKNARLIGLPDGVTVTGYVGNGVINAGLYVISAELSYDEENYNPPIIPDAVMTIERQVVVIPDIEKSEYTSELIFPKVEASELYDYEFSGAIDSGVYTLNFTLTDAENYCFEGNLDTVEKSFEITKRKITVRISDVEVYIGEKHSAPSFEIISGELAAGETLEIKYDISENEIFGIFNEDNYEIEVIAGNVLRNKRLSPEDTRILVLVLSITVLGIISIVIVIINRKRLLAYYKRVVSKNDSFIPSMPIVTEEGTASANGGFTETEKKMAEEEAYEEVLEYSDAETVAEEVAAEERKDMISDSVDNDIDCYKELEYPVSEATVIDSGYADSVITDSLARSLIRKDGDIETEGRRKEIINVDTLSRSFSAGERVDINLLKGKSLIPYDTGYIKILARGIIDKPLDVYANDFSLSAVKMIALAGGKSIKAGTVSPIKSVGKENFKKRT